MRQTVSYYFLIYMLLLGLSFFYKYTPNIDKISSTINPEQYSKIISIVLIMLVTLIPLIIIFVLSENRIESFKFELDSSKACSGGLYLHQGDDEKSKKCREYILANKDNKSNCNSEVPGLYKFTLNGKHPNFLFST